MSKIEVITYWPQDDHQEPRVRIVLDGEDLPATARLVSLGGQSESRGVLVGIEFVAEEAVIRSVQELDPPVPAEPEFWRDRDGDFWRRIKGRREYLECFQVRAFYPGWDCQSTLEQVERIYGPLQPAAAADLPEKAVAA